MGDERSRHDVVRRRPSQQGDAGHHQGHEGADRGQYTLVEILAPEGFASPLHVHHGEDEGFYILEGEMTFYVGDRTIKARPGSFLFGPEEVPYAFKVDSGPARLFFVLSPAGFEDLVRE